MNIFLRRTKVDADYGLPNGSKATVPFERYFFTVRTVIFSVRTVFFTVRTVFLPFER